MRFLGINAVCLASLDAGAGVAERGMAAGE
jgi:hypothetical protein